MILLHVARADAWTGADHAPPELARDGFLHCCTEAQLAFVLARFFPVRAGHVAVRFAADRAGDVRWERSEPDQDPFPHLYGPLPVAAVVSVTALE